MPMGPFVIYGANKDDLRLQDLPGATVKAALVVSAYAPDAGTGGDDTWADVSAHEIAAGNGYTAGGLALTTKAVTASGSGWVFTADDIEWTASGSGIPAWRRVVLYVEGTLWGKTNPLIGAALADTTPADAPLTPAGNPLVIELPASVVLSVA